MLRWHSQTQPLCGGQSPDQCARLLAGLAVLSGDEGVALHSTSWRHEGSQVMLTYALFPAGDADIGWTPLNEHLAVCQGPLQPSPEHVGDRHVAAHAARHLSDLATGRDPHLTRCAELRPYEWNLLRAHAATVHVHSAVVVTG
ncbi:MAG: hypothetical protein H7323_17550 [Frankiales bacterium]|nr:hypothetical protein [Frankiales bacterium]